MRQSAWFVEAKNRAGKRGEPIRQLVEATPLLNFYAALTLSDQNSHTLEYGSFGQIGFLQMCCAIIRICDEM
jgi:hypothetical protein